MNSKVDHLHTHHSLQWADRLQDAVEGDLIGPDLAALSEHLGGCDACRSDYLALQALSSTLNSQISAPTLAPDFDARVLAHISTLAGSFLAQARDLEQREHLARVARHKRNWRSFLRFNVGNLLGGVAVLVAVFSALGSGPVAVPIAEILQQSAFTASFLLIVAAIAVTWALRGGERTL